MQKPDADAPPLAEAPPTILIPAWILVGASVYFGIDATLTSRLSSEAVRALMGVAP